MATFEESMNRGIRTDLDGFFNYNRTIRGNLADWKAQIARARQTGDPQEIAAVLNAVRIAPPAWLGIFQKVRQFGGRSGPKLDAALATSGVEKAHFEGKLTEYEAYYTTFRDTAKNSLDAAEAAIDALAAALPALPPPEPESIWDGPPIRVERN